MTNLVDKFGILSNTRFDSDIKKKNFIENYLNNNFICHHDLVKNQNISINDINFILKNHLRKHKTTFSRMIKFGKINMDSIIDFVNETKIKFNFIKSICDNEFPNDNELITNIILSNPSIDKLISSYINDRKSIKKYLITFNKFNTDEENKNTLDLKIAKFIVENLPIIDSKFFQNNKLYMLWEMDSNINYYITMNKKYDYFSEKCFNELLDIIQKNIGNCIIGEHENFLKYFQANSNKFDKIFDFINEDKVKKQIQDTLLFFKPSNLRELYDFTNILLNMHIVNKNTIIDNFIQINKSLINEENIKFITNKINNNILNNISNENNYQFIKNIKFNQDLIIADLTLFLMKRYIYFENFDNSYENKEYELIKYILPKNILYKYMKVINDINHKLSYMYTLTDLSSIYISKSIWNFDYEKGYKKVVNKVTSKVEENNHNLQYFLHLGEVVTDFTTSSGTYKIRMLPIHYEIINNPNNFENELKNYKKDYLNFIFQQLLENEILELTNQTSEGKFQINKDYNGGDLDLIKFSNETSTMPDIEEVIRREVSLERKEIIMANINSILKINNNSLSFNEIFGMVNDKLSMYFDTDKGFFKNIVKEMIDKEYICGDSSIEDTSPISKKLIY